MNHHENEPTNHHENEPMNHHENEPMKAHDSWADHYDCVYKLTYGEGYQRFTDQTLDVIRQLEPSPARIVEFGPGTGRLAIPLAQMGYRVTAVEASAEMCRVLKAKAAAGVEGSVATPCVVCQRSSVPTEQRRPVEVMVYNQSICQQMPDNGFDLGLCVFTVLNYLVEEDDMHRFATVAASAIRPGGKLLVSFVDDMAPMMNIFNGKPKSGKSPNGGCSALRNIRINPLQETRYEYDEKSALTKDGRKFSYSDNFRLREWSQEQIVTTIEAAGFRKEDDLAGKLHGLGEVYLLFSRKSPAQNRPAVPPRTGENPRAVLDEIGYAACFTNPPKHLIDRVTKTQRYRDSQIVLENLHKHQVFYYPGACLDWEPLRRLTHLCDTFIFCDWNVSAESVTGDFGLAGVTTDFIIPLCKEDVAYLADRNPLHRSLEYRVAALVGGPAEPWEPWAKYAQLTRTVGGVTRKLHFFYLGMEGITAYFNLFAPHKMAPRVLCMQFGMDSNGVQFGDWADGLLGKIIRGVAWQCEGAVGVGGPGANLPYPTLLHEWPGWPKSPNAYVPEIFSTGQVQPAPWGGAPRRVIVRPGLLTPENVGDCDAIVLTITEYRQHLAAWPAHLRIFLLVPPDQNGQLPVFDDQVRFLRHEPYQVRFWPDERPLQDVLNNLDAVCGQENIWRVASVGIGYEDKGQLLDKWRHQSGMPLELTIYHQGTRMKRSGIAAKRRKTRKK